MVAWQAGQAAVAKMELEVSYDENYCLEGRAERRRGATDTTDEAREAVGMACVDRHIFFITPLMVCLERQIALAPTMSPAPPQATTTRTATEAWLGRTSSYASISNSPLRSSSACAAQKGYGSGAPRGRCEAGRGQAGGSGGAQGASLRCAWKVAPRRTSTNTRIMHLMRFHTRVA